MNLRSTMMKKRSALAAHGSVKAEGVAPTKATTTKIQNYLDGKVTKKELRQSVVAEAKHKHSDKYGAL